ncbi:MAG: peptidase [Elusimicrobia bacterium RIFOXYA2_FULL_58_8]|nr:MAG: peptidase [Elusimicrobia bacterium RIFOXYA2_FULL_58_8]
MYKFPEGLYSDVRVEKVRNTLIQYLKGELREMRERDTAGAFVRVYDGQRWYYSSITALDKVQEELDRLAKLAKPSKTIAENSLVKNMAAGSGGQHKFKGKDLRALPLAEKNSFLTAFFPAVTAQTAIAMWSAMYTDTLTHRELYNSKGAQSVCEQQLCGVRLGMTFTEGGHTFTEGATKAGGEFCELADFGRELDKRIAQALEFLRNSVRVKPGKYTVVLSPLAAGVFAHESFGHKSEADFMLGDAAMLKEWHMGRQLGPEFLHISDDGACAGSGFTPFDDEGNPARKTTLIKNGRLAGRLHSAATAAALDEAPTGNARAISFEFEPIVRMTTTHFEAGNIAKEELFAGVKDGLFIDTIKHGSGMSTFTIAPSLAYFIKDGKIAGPAQISVISGSVFDTFGLIDAISDKVELLSFVGGGCGKMEQYPLPVGFGGPYVRVREMAVL